MTRSTPLLGAAGAVLTLAAFAQEATLAPTPAPADELAIVAAKSAPVPGMVEIVGGRTTVGTSKEEVEALLVQYPNFVRVLDAQTPQQAVEIPTFWLATNELTNAEYLAFVEATGHQPPLHWANEKAMQDAALAHAKEQHEKSEAAKAEGRQYEKLGWADGPSPTPRERWWAANWREVGHAIPEGADRFPVVYVTYDDAVTYCDWAGVRLPTEFELQRAARKDTKTVFPWGDAWEDGKYCNTAEMRRAKPFAVGSFAAGTSPFGVNDLSGNVWEWTSSPYVAYKGFKKGEYNVTVTGKKEKRSADAIWDPNQRVVFGGSFQEPQLASRINTRRGTERTQFTDALGFRVAASAKVGFDKAGLLIENEVRLSAARPDGVTYAPEGVVALDRWRVGAPGIVGYDHVLFLPVAEVAEGNTSDFELASRRKPVHIGVFSTGIDLLEPELAAGSYYVAYRAKGKVPRPTAEEKEKGKDAPDGEKPADDKGKDEKGKKDDKEQEPEAPLDPLIEGLDLEKDWLLFIRVSDGTRAATIQVTEGLTWGKGKGGGLFKVRADKVRVGSGADARIEDQTFFDLECGLTGKLRGQALPLKFTVRPSKAAFGAPWRQ